MTFGAGYVQYWHDSLVSRLSERAPLEAIAAERNVPVSDHADYGKWRNLVDHAVSKAEEVLADRRRYGIHLERVARRGEGMESALTRMRAVLREDDRHIAASLVPKRTGQSRGERQQRIERLLNDPEKLAEMRKRRESEERRKAEERQRKGRYRSRGLRI